MVRRLIVPFTFAAVVMSTTQLFAQGVFPAPLPGETTLPPGNASPFPPASSPPTNGAPPAGDDTCMKEFAPLRAEAEERGKLLKAAGARNALPDETCQLIGSFFQSEIKMIAYVQANAARCGIPPDIVDRLRTGHKNTEELQIKICNAARTPPRGPSLNDVLGPPKREPAGPLGDFGR